MQRSSLRNKKIAQQSAKNNIGGSFGAKSSLHHSVMSKLRTAGSKDNVDPTNNLSADFTSTKQMESSNLTRESIIERLLRFFRSRPSMESLRERGIYKRMFFVAKSAIVKICLIKICTPKDLYDTILVGEVLPMIRHCFQRSRFLVARCLQFVRTRKVCFRGFLLKSLVLSRRRD